MQIEDRLFGKTSDGQKIFAFTFSNRNGLEMTVINYGAILQSFRMPGKNGKKDELTLGFDTVEEYEADPSYFGAVIGRVAGRISRGEFSIDGRKYILDKNDGENHLHGGFEGFGKKVWDIFPFVLGDTAGVKLFLESEDGDQGYPGKLEARITISLDEENNLIFDYSAETSAITPVSLTNHSYWNLSGAVEKTVLDHVLYSNSSRYLQNGRGFIPTGTILAAENTPFDFLHGTEISSRFPEEGYDNYLILDEKEKNDSPDIVLSHSETGREIRIFTDFPGFVLYTGNFLEGRSCRRGRLSKYAAMCIETMDYPDAVNKSNFPDIILNPGERYSRQTRMKFSTGKIHRS